MPLALWAGFSQDIFIVGMENSLDVVILAAGGEKEFVSQRPKILHELLGLTLLEYIIRVASKLSPARMVLIMDKGAAEVREALARRGIGIPAIEAGGRGHCLGSIEGAVTAPRLLVLPGDHPLLSPKALERLLREHIAQEALLSFLTFDPGDAGSYPRVIRDESGTPKTIVTEDTGTGAREAAAAVFLLENVPETWEALKRLPPGCSSGALLAELVPTLYPKVHAVPWPEPGDLLAVRTRGDLARAGELVRDRIIRRLQEAGVTVVDPRTVYIGPDVAVGGDTVLHPGVYLYGRTEIAASCEIGPQAYLVDTTVGREAKIWFSVLEGAYVEERARIGPYAHLRPGARIGRGARIGNFVEVKNADIGEGVRAGHLAYIGDAEVGEGTNIGAGTITCNYDGVRKHRTVIGKGAFIGSNTSLVAPVTVGEGAIVGAGSVITEDVPPYALALGRARQVIKPDWAKNKGGA